MGVNLIGINITLAVSLNLINGLAGQFSIGHAGDRNDIVTMLADWSDADKAGEIGVTLEALGSSQQVPLLAIFPAGDPYRPQTLTGMYTRADVLRKLNAAGPSNTPRLAADRR